MKKITMLAAIAAVTIFASCNKYEQTVVEAGSASVSIELGVNTNETNDTTYYGAIETTYENVPSGTQVIVQYDSEDIQINPRGGYDYEIVSQIATVDANSELNFTVPAIETAHTITLKFPDLELSTLVSDISPLTGDDTTYFETRIYTKGDMTVSVYDGAIELREDEIYN